MPLDNTESDYIYYYIPLQQFQGLERESMSFCERMICKNFPGDAQVDLLQPGRQQTLGKWRLQGLQHLGHRPVSVLL